MTQNSYNRSIASCSLEFRLILSATSNERHACVEVKVKARNEDVVDCPYGKLEELELLMLRKP